MEIKAFNTIISIFTKLEDNFINKTEMILVQENL